MVEAHWWYSAGAIGIGYCVPTACLIVRRLIPLFKQTLHPQGVLHTMAESLQETEEAEARQRLSLLVTMMNPCVGWEVQGYA